jgi:hypothetical protein
VRTLLGWLLLLTLCALAGYLQSRWSRSIRAERRELLSAPVTREDREEQWGEITIGRPSGAERIDLETLLPPLTEEDGPARGGESGARDDGAQSSRPSDYRPADFLYTVPEGRVLSKICEDFYGTGRPPVPERVAAYNGLSSPDALKAGKELRLPPWEVLFPQGR